MVVLLKHTLSPCNPLFRPNGDKLVAYNFHTGTVMLFYRRVMSL